MQIDYVLQETGLGWMILAKTPHGICFLFIDDDPQQSLNQLKLKFPKANYQEKPESFSEELAVVLAYLESPKQACNLPLDIQGTPFQKAVWQVLREIPVGQTMSYKEVAERLNKPKAVRAVGSACGANPIAVLIPCHRVLTSDGKLGGFSMGLKRKKVLLKREGVEFIS